MSSEDRTRARILHRLFRGRRDLHARRRPGEGWDVVPGPAPLEELERHVRGELEVGLYGQSGSPEFLVLRAPDAEGAQALLRAARLRNIPLAPAGDGLQLWIPFSAPVPPRAARDLADHLQAVAGLRPEVWDPDSPQPLPLPPDQPGAWEELHDLEPMPPWRPVRILAERLDREYGPLPSCQAVQAQDPTSGRLQVILGSHLELRGPVPRALQSLLEHTRMARTPRGWARCWGPTPWGLVGAPGLWPDLEHALARLGCSWQLEDRRLTGPSSPPGRQPALRQEESTWLSGILEQDRCRVTFPLPETARRVALAAIAARPRPTLVLTSQVQTWVEEITRELALPEARIGILDGEKARLGSLVTVASWSALFKRDLSELACHVGCLILDPGADLSGPALIEVVRQFPVRWVLTLENPDWSASPAMRQAWLGDRLRPQTRAFRPAPVASEEETPPSPAPRRRRSRRSSDSSEQLLLSFE